MRFPKGLIVLVAGCLSAASLNAQARDPRIGEWREDRTANSGGLYNVFEDRGDGMIRYHIAHNLAPENRFYLDYRCDGKFYPIRNSQRIATDYSESCTIIDANTVTIQGLRNRDRDFKGPKMDEGWLDGEGTGTVSSDGNHYRIAIQQRGVDGKELGTMVRSFTRNAQRCFSEDEQTYRECQRRTSPPRN